MGSHCSILTAGFVVPIVAALACTPSQSPSPEPGAPDPAVTAAASPGTEDPVAADPGSADPGSGEPAAEDKPIAEPGALALPPGSASAWNTGQSDGQPGKADRGIQDYQRIIQEHREKFRSCYDAARAKRDGIKGRVTLVWVLDPKGAIRDGAHIDPKASDFHDEFLEQCMVGAVKTLTFPPSRRGMDSTVRYPFDFRPQGRPR